jgi:hypothetical protein
LQALGSGFEQRRRHCVASGHHEFEFLQALTGVRSAQLRRVAAQGRGKTLYSALQAVERLVGQAGERRDRQKCADADQDAENSRDCQCAQQPMRRRAHVQGIGSAQATF